MPTLHSHSSGTLILEEPTTTGRKRSYHDFLRSGSRSTSPTSSPSHLRFSITPSPSNSLTMSRASPIPPRRFIGDGLDYRRPVMSTSARPPAVQIAMPATDVIDLTYDSDTSVTRPTTTTTTTTTRRASVERQSARLNTSTRRHRDSSPGQRRREAQAPRDRQDSRAPVIDVETMNFGTVVIPADPYGTGMVTDEDFLSLFRETPGSPGFEIVGERSVHAEVASRSVAQRRPTPYAVEEVERMASEAPELPPPLFHNLPHGLASWIARAGTSISGSLAGRVERNASQQYPYTTAVYAPAAAAELTNASGWHAPAQLQLPRIPALDLFQPPRMNYEAQGFELVGAARSSPPPRPSSPHKAPRAAAPGFTRKVDEDEVVVCPHCGDELGTGDSDLKQQIWVVKQCGHVYCGECAAHRHVGRGKKMPAPVEGKPAPFKVCVVQDCKKPVVSKTALFQVYL